MSAAKTVVVTVLAMSLVAALAFLYYKTDIGDFRRQTQIAAHLRALKEVDTRWEIELLRLRTEPVTNGAASAHVADTLRRALQGLELDASASRTVSFSLPELRRAFTDKADLMGQYRTAAGGAREHLHAALAAGPELANAFRQTQLAAPRLADRVRALERAHAVVQAEMLRFHQVPDTSQAGRLQAALMGLNQIEPVNGGSLPGLVERFRTAVERFYQSRAQEQEIYTRLTYLTAGPRLDTLTLAFQRELDVNVQEKELFRTALITYAGVLLILLSHIGTRLRQSYVEVARANTALQEANEGLERRVQERTRELSGALKSLEESQAMLVQSEKMSSLGQMVAGIAHEINTPLAYVKNSLESVEGRLPELTEAAVQSEKLLAMLREGADETSFGKQYAAVAALLARLREDSVTEDLSKLVQDGQYGITQIAEIVGNLRNFSRLDRKKVDRFNVADGLESTLSIAKHMLKSVTVRKQYGKVPPITCSPSQLNQVFLNLVSNAVQATEGKAGEITLITRAPDAEHVEVVVADNGKGIAPEVLPKIFDPFFTTKEVGKGTGLGLSIAYKIVEAHGGRISVESDAGLGTRFTVRLPVHPPANAELA